MPQKMLLCFSNISAKILGHIQAKAFVLAVKFGTFFPYAADIKSIKNSAQKLLCFGTKSVGEIDPWCLIVAPIDIYDIGICSQEQAITSQCPKNEPHFLAICYLADSHRIVNKS